MHRPPWWLLFSPLELNMEGYRYRATVRLHPCPPVAAPKGGPGPSCPALSSTLLPSITDSPEPPYPCNPRTLHTHTLPPAGEVPTLPPPLQRPPPPHLHHQLIIKPPPNSHLHLSPHHHNTTSPPPQHQPPHLHPVLSAPKRPEIGALVEQQLPRASCTVASSPLATLSLNVACGHRHLRALAAQWREPRPVRSKHGAGCGCGHVRTSMRLGARYMYSS